VNAYGYDVDDVLRCVDPALDDLDEPSLLYVKYVREEFVRAAATLDAYPLPAKIRQAVESLFGGVFEISRIGGEDRGRRRERRARTLKATSVRVLGQRPAIEARREKIRAFCKKRKWLYDMPELPGRLADELGDPDGKKRTRATLRKLYARDLIELARDTTT
jgi:hypothetical protein